MEKLERNSTKSLQDWLKKQQLEILGEWNTSLLTQTGKAVHFLSCSNNSGELLQSQSHVTIHVTKLEDYTMIELRRNKQKRLSSQISLEISKDQKKRLLVVCPTHSTRVHHVSII